MKKIVLTFGLISGVIASAMMFLTLPLMDRGIINFKNGEVFGYTTIFLSMLLVFFGIRSYRENVGGGKIGFWRGVAIGLLITAISSACYVISWEIIYYNISPDFVDKYAAASLEELHKSGASPAAIEARKAQMAQLKELYANPAINAAITFLEPLPVGVLVTLISATILCLTSRSRSAPATAPQT